MARNMARKREHEQRCDEPLRVGTWCPSRAKLAVPLLGEVMEHEESRGTTIWVTTSRLM